MGKFVSVVGLGYLGLTHAVALANSGFKVFGFDSNEDLIRQILDGKAPFFEPGLEQGLNSAIATGNLIVKSQLDESLGNCDYHLLCVGTPINKQSGQIDTNQLLDVFLKVLEFSKPDSLFIGKSTVPVGTSQNLLRLASKVFAALPDLVWNPEFLREGSAIQDIVSPARVVLGSNSRSSFIKARRFYEEQVLQDIPIIETNFESAELIKVAANAFLAMKISFINGVAGFAEDNNADMDSIAFALGLDDRIGHKFLKSGIGFGGGCLPKDLRGLITALRDTNHTGFADLLSNVDTVNNARRDAFVNKISESIDLQGKIVCALGATFKPNTDDIRESPSIYIARELAKMGATVKITDPRGLVKLEKFSDSIELEPDIEKALLNADAVVLLTEWDQYLKLDPQFVGNLVKTKIVFDGRNALDALSWRNAGFRVISFGRLG